MLAFRSFSRALSRTALRSPAIRTRTPSRLVSFQYKSIVSQPTLQRSFATSKFFRDAAGDSDPELSAKLAQERQLEVDGRDPTQYPQDIDDFLNDSGFKIQDKPGTEDVVLTKTFGNETIKIEFNIADMNEAQDMEELDEDTALEDEAFGSEVDGQGRRTINQASGRGGKVNVAPEDSIATGETDAEFEPEESEIGSYPLNLSITISKAGKGATHIMATAQDGEIEVMNVHYYPKAELVDPKTPEQAKESQSLYGGPPFAHLDMDLQAMYETYIQERGINTQLALFLPRYVDFKEQREYVQWLDNMKNFVDA